jgi:hypothetical protein
VLAPGGTAVFVTPNRLTFARPDEIIDPYHYAEYDPAQLAELVRPFFTGVEVGGVFGSLRHEAFVAREHAKLDRMLRLDPLRLRRLIPRRARQRLYDWRLTRERGKPDPEAEAIGPGDFTLGWANVEAAYDLVAVCRLERSRQ